MKGVREKREVMANGTQEKENAKENGQHLICTYIIQHSLERARSIIEANV